MRKKVERINPVLHAAAMNFFKPPPRGRGTTEGGGRSSSYGKT